MNKSLFEKLLDNYHLTEQDYLALIQEHTLDDFACDHHFKDIELAASLVKEAISNKHKIAIYGDYDADGIMGTSILVKMFHMLNYPVTYYLPNRYKDGYAITLKKAEEFVKDGISLVITVDNGVSAFEAINYLKAHDVDVLILDHHAYGETLPNANYIIHPIYSGFGEVASSGAFTAFMFSKEVLGYYDKYLATLAAISLITDCMPLLEYNRNLLRVVFKDYQEGEFLNISLLADHEPLDENVIGMKIGPRINALGRLIEDETINQIIPYFAEDNHEYQLNYINYLIELNEKRKVLTNEPNDLNPNDLNACAIVTIVDAKEGIIGLIANALANKYHKPAIVFAKSENGILKGSARCEENFSIVDIFDSLKPLLVSGGGHASAGGCSIKETDYAVFKEKFIAFAYANIKNVVNKIDSIQININDVNRENYQLLKSFSPFGVNWPAPSLLLKHIKTSALTFSKDQRHIIATIGNATRIIGFSMPKNEVQSFDFINVHGTLRKNVYKGFVNVEFLIKKYTKSVD